MYLKLCSFIHKASSHLISKCKYRKYLKPFRNKELNTLHYRMRDKGRKWGLIDKPRTPSYTEYSEDKEKNILFRNKHRFYAEQYLSSLNNEIDNAAVLEPCVFGDSTVHVTEKKYGNLPNTCSSSVMKFDNVIYRKHLDVGVSISKTCKNVVQITTMIMQP